MTKVCETDQETLDPDKAPLLEEKEHYLIAVSPFFEWTKQQDGAM